MLTLTFIHTTTIIRIIIVTSFNTKGYPKYMEYKDRGWKTIEIGQGLARRDEKLGDAARNH